MTNTLNHSGPFDNDEQDAISLRVIGRISQATGSDPTELEPLYESVDPDCLNNLFADGQDSQRRRDGKITFTMEGCEVVVRADGTIDVSHEAASQNAPEAERGADGSTEVSEPTD